MEGALSFARQFDRSQKRVPGGGFCAVMDVCPFSSNALLKDRRMERVVIPGGEGGRGRSRSTKLCEEGIEGGWSRKAVEPFDFICMTIPLCADEGKLPAMSGEVFR